MSEHNHDPLDDATLEDATLEDNPLDALLRSVDDEERIDAGAADRIEAQLRVAHAGSHRSQPQRFRPALAAAVALVAVVALSVLLVLRDPDPSAALVVTDADNVTVRLADGTVIADPRDGFALPDGAIVEIGVGGTVTVDDVVLETAGLLEVRDGRLVADVVATTTTPDRIDDPDPEVPNAEPPTDTSTATVTTTTAVTTTTSAPEATTPPARDSTTTTTVRDERDESPVDEPDRGEPTDTRGDASQDERTDDSDRDGDGRDAGRSGDEAGEATVAIALDLQRAEGGIRIAWEVDRLDPGWTVAIQRRIGDGAPTTVVTSADRTGAHLDQPTTDDGRPIDGRLRYRVAILDEAGGEVASGPSQSLR